MKIILRFIRHMLPYAAIGLVILIALYAIVIRPWIFRIGATTSEVKAKMAGDELVVGADSGYTQAITINAPPSFIYPYIVQMGMKRGGWYNLDFINRMAGKNYFYENNASASRIIPQLQGVKTGDKISIAPGLDFTVKEEVKNDHLLLAAMDGDHAKVTWNYTLKRINDKNTRLIVRWKSISDKDLMMRLINYFVIDPGGSGIQQRLNMKGIKKRAERDYHKI